MYGAKIKAIREARGFDQNYVAKRSNILQSTYCKIENNTKVKVDEILLQKIAEVLGVSLIDIKSATPIVMSFDTFKNNTNMQFEHNQVLIQHNHVNEKIIDQLTAQLVVKDKQLEQKDKQINLILLKIKV